MDEENKIYSGNDYVKSNDGSVSLGFKAIRGCHKLLTHDKLYDMPGLEAVSDIIEVRFKNTRKDFYKNVNNIVLKLGDIVAVEASPGHDIGVVSLTGYAAALQMRKKNIDLKNYEYKKVYRKAKQNDIEKWEEAKQLEPATLKKAREIVELLKLQMKLGDVEYQGDKTKAIFYYIAEERVDFRELIKKYAEQFKVRIEMKQIGARQEAGRIGGVAACGRELCCSMWRTSFVSVPTNSARIQELPINAQKLAGQCSKLKCCLIYELDVYLSALEDLPKHYTQLETNEGPMFHQKTDILQKVLWYSFDKDNPREIYPLPLKKVKEVLEINKRGKKAFQVVDTKQKGSMAADMLNYEKSGSIDQLRDYKE